MQQEDKPTSIRFKGMKADIEKLARKYKMKLNKYVIKIMTREVKREAKK